MDAVTLEVYRHLLAAIPEEMGASLRRSAWSTNIKERRDYSCALFDGAGGLVAEAAHIPVHLGAMPLSVRAAVSKRSLGPGDVVLVNDPYAGGTHLPDLTVVAAVHHRGRRVGYVANRAHHADVGGATPGSMGPSTEIHQEGLRIPPVFLVRGGRLGRDVLDLLLANMRVREEREGDLRAQLAALHTGARRLRDLVRRRGAAEVARAGRALADYSEGLARRAIRAIRAGVYRFEDRLDDDGVEPGPVAIRVDVRVRGSTLEADFRRSAPQCAGPLNASPAIALSATLYVLRTLLDGPVPMNQGLIRPLRVLTRTGTVLDPRPPAAVAGGNVETAQRVVDVLYGALAQALPGRIGAASAGTMTNLALGGMDPRTGRAWSYYETVAGGMGARPWADGLDAVQTHMTNTLNTPVEALEAAFPLRVRRYEVRRGSGGAGRYRGGDGIRREVEILAPCTATVLADRQR
ncbi:MAG: hydantoinase B/oxoprolinase family protein, partial [Planctomycetes bacterium]|nr:hydantoinase B/oxoprolinase family protein [Planctomycetota bacterium]